MARTLCTWFIALDIAVIFILWAGRHKEPDGFIRYAPESDPKRHWF